MQQQVMKQPDRVAMYVVAAQLLAVIRKVGDPVHIATEIEGCIFLALHTQTRERAETTAKLAQAWYAANKNACAHRGLGVTSFVSYSFFLGKFTTVVRIGS